MIREKKQLTLKLSECDRINSNEWVFNRRLKELLQLKKNVIIELKTHRTSLIALTGIKHSKTELMNWKIEKIISNKIR